MTNSSSNSAQPSLETERLLLRPFRADDGNNLFRLYGNPEVMNIRKIGLQTREQSNLQLAEIVDHWQRRGFGLAAVMEKSTSAFIGECGLRERVPGLDEIELSYGLVPDAWGRGYASEAGKAALDHGLNELRLETIYAHARADNHASRRVLEKLGFLLVEYLDKDAAHQVARYAIVRDNQMAQEDKAS